MKEHFSILIFEKDENIGSILHEFMQMAEVRSRVFNNHEEAYDAFCEENDTVCLIALDSYSEKGLLLARRIKAVNKKTILIFTCEHPTEEVVTKAYEAGADDLIRKPFILEELYLRTVAIIKRMYDIKTHQDRVYIIGKYLFDTHKQTLSVNGTSTKLTTKENELLRYLCENINSVVERKRILKDVWNHNSYYTARSMDVYLTKLRRLLKDDESISIINVHGRGFKLVTDIPTNAKQTLSRQVG